MTVATTNIIVNERSSITFQSTFKDDDGVELVPKSIIWSLVDKDGNIINNREGVSITPASVVKVSLSNDDLALSEQGIPEYRYFTIVAVYDTATGTNLQLTDQVEFFVRDLIAIDVAVSSLRIYYWGLDEAATLTGAELEAAFAKQLAPHETRVVSYDTAGTPQYVYYAFEKALGELNDIILNEVSALAAFTLYEETIDSILCYVYQSTDKISEPLTYTFER